MEIGKTLDVSNRLAWRKWLRENHTTEPEIWLVYYSKASGKPRIPYNDAVDEALCFGWIDSIVKKLDSERRAQRFTPRRPGSKLSPMNKERVRRLVAARRMTQAGLASVGATLDEDFEVPSDILEALKGDQTAWNNFQAFPESYKRIRVGWIDGARRWPEIFQQRLSYFLNMTAKNNRFGMVQ